MPVRVGLLSVAWLACGVAVAAVPERHALDPVHTRLLVAVDHAGFSQALGTVSGSGGVLLVPQDGWDGASLDVVVPLARLDFGDAAWNRAMQGRTWLDVARHPRARFTSTQVTPVDATRARICGTLQLRGIEGPLCLDVVRNAARRNPLPPFRRTAGFSATGTLSRAAFGIDAWRRLVGDAVALRIEVEAVRDDTAQVPAPDDMPGDAAQAASDAAGADDPDAADPTARVAEPEPRVDSVSDPADPVPDPTLEPTHELRSDPDPEPEPTP